MRVWLDPVKLNAYGLTVLDVQQAIQNQNVQVASGQLGGPPVSADQMFQFTVNTMGRLSSVSEFENIIVKVTTPSTQSSQQSGAASTSQAAAVRARTATSEKSSLASRRLRLFQG